MKPSAVIVIYAAQFTDLLFHSRIRSRPLVGGYLRLNAAHVDSDTVRLAPSST
jgi:hypothetical protein